MHHTRLSFFGESPSCGETKQALSITSSLRKEGGVSAAPLDTCNHISALSNQHKHVWFPCSGFTVARCYGLDFDSHSQRCVLEQSLTLHPATLFPQSVCLLLQRMFSAVCLSFWLSAGRPASTLYSIQQHFRPQPPK